jgi:hypothetical protein
MGWKVWEQEQEERRSKSLEEKSEGEEEWGQVSERKSRAENRKSKGRFHQGRVYEAGKRVLWAVQDKKYEREYFFYLYGTVISRPATSGSPGGVRNGPGQ